MDAHKPIENDTHTSTLNGDIVDYPGKELEAMDLARNYHRWIFDLMRPHLGSRIVEVGAGTGGFSELLLEHDADTFTFIEPSAMFKGLERRVGECRVDASVILLKALFTSVATEVAMGSPDSIVYNNVLEHIEDDIKELRCVRNSLVPGGRVLIFVPAWDALFSEFDRMIGHFRRYTRAELVGKVEAAGFRIVEIRNVDSLGILPWFVKYRLLKSVKMEPGMVSLYDRTVIPLLRRFEAILEPPIGKNLFLAAERTA